MIKQNSDKFGNWFTIFKLKFLDRDADIFFGNLYTVESRCPHLCKNFGKPWTVQGGCEKLGNGCAKLKELYIFVQIRFDSMASVENLHYAVQYFVKCGQNNEKVWTKNSNCEGQYEPILAASE